MDTSVVQLLRELDAQPPFATLDVLRAHLTSRVDALDVGLWLVDYEQERLREWLASGRPGEERPVEDGVWGRVFREQRSHTEADGADVAMIAPITIRAERLGVLEVRLIAEPDRGSSEIIEASAAVIAYVLLAARRYTDLFERVRRRKDLEVPAELQWELLPVLAHDGPDFDIAGSLEPAYDIGGDNFDYAVERDSISVSITDAMGHGTHAAMLCGLAVAVMRNARRRGMSPRQQVRAANVAIHDQYGGEAFVTHLGMRINRADGEAGLVNAGHSYAYLLRGPSVSVVEVEVDIPVGLFTDADYTQQTVRFAPGDRLLLVTDGVLEAESASGEAFGHDRVVALLEGTAADRPAELVRKLTRDVMAHRGAPLADDATAVCVDYRRRSR